MKKYIVIIGDLIKSKNIPNRFEFQERLKDIFTGINTKYKRKPLTVNTCSFIS